MGRVLSTSHGTNAGAFAPVEWGLFVAIGGIWGSSFLLIAIGLDAFEPGFVTWLRVAAGAATLWAFPGARRPVAREDRARIVALSVLWVAIPFTLFPLAQQWVTSAAAGMLNGGLPILAVAVGSLMLRRAPTRAQVLGLALGTTGIVAIAAPAAGQGSSQALGVGLVLLAVLCYGFAINIAAPVQQRYGSLPVMARMLGLSAIWTAPFGAVGLAGSSFSAASLAAVLALGAAGTGVAFFLMGVLVGRVGGPRASFSTYLIPVVALGLGVALRDDHVAAISVAGVGLVVAGAALASRPDRR